MRIADYVELQPQDMKDFMKLARERFKIAVDAESSEREKRLEDLKFATGDQWPQETKRIRDASNRPCLTINRYPAVKGQIVNEQRAQRPQIIVKPVGGGADEDDAMMLEGLLRHIQVNSDAEIAFDTAFEHMVLKCSIECDLRITVHLNVPQQTFEHLSVVLVRSATYWLDDDLRTLRALLVDDLTFHRRVAVDRQAWP